MASYNLKFNSDDSVIRHIIIGFLADLNNRVYFHRQLSNDERVVIDVPFYYSITGDDQFLRDNFLFSTASGPDCHPDKGFADGNYDTIPRGIANLTSLSIDSAKLVNKRTMGNYTKMDRNGSMEGHSAEFDMIPINLGFDIEVLVSSTLDSLKITESIIKRLYKSNYFNVEVGHLNEGTYRIASYYAFPDDYSNERPLEFTFEDKELYKLTFPIEVSSFIPAFHWGNSEGVDAGSNSFTYDPSDLDDPNNPNSPLYDPTSQTGKYKPSTSRSTARKASNRMFSIKTNTVDVSSRQIDERDVDKDIT